MPTVSLQDAQSHLAELIHGLRFEEELVITENEQPIAKLNAVVGPPDHTPRKSGTLRGTVLYMADDFNAPMDDFKEYME